MTVPQLNTLVGKQIKDSYGRYLGIIAGISTDSSGNIRSLGVDTGCSGFKAIDGEQIFFEDDSPIFISEWRLDADKFMKTSGLAEKKMQALEELYTEGEITQSVYEQLAARHKEQFNIDFKSRDDIMTGLNDKVTALNSENSIVDGFLGNLKLQHRIGEIDDTTYQSTCEYIDTILQCNEKEVAGISAILNDLMPPEPSLDVEKAGTEETTTVAADEPTPEIADEPVAEVINESEASTEEPAVSSDDSPPVEVITVAQQDAPMPNEEITSTNISESEAPDTVSMEKQAVSPDVVNTPSLDEEISVDAEVDAGASDSEEVSTITAEDTPMTPDVTDTPSFTDNVSEGIESQAVEESTIDAPEVPEITAEVQTTEQQVSDLPAEQESIDYSAPEEVTEVSDHMLVEETEATADKVTASDDDEDDAENTEIQDSVSFEDESADIAETTSSDEVTDTPDSDADSEEDKIVYSTQ
jgi:hypothetical protein